MTNTIKNHRKRKLSVSTAKVKTMQKRDLEIPKAGVKSKNISVKIVTDFLLMMRAFIECVTLIRPLL